MTPPITLPDLMMSLRCPAKASHLRLGLPRFAGELPTSSPLSVMYDETAPLRARFRAAWPGAVVHDRWPLPVRVAMTKVAIRDALHRQLQIRDAPDIRIHGATFFGWDDSVIVETECIVLRPSSWMVVGRLITATASIHLGTSPVPLPDDKHLELVISKRAIGLNWRDLVEIEQQRNTTHRRISPSDSERATHLSRSESRGRLETALELAYGHPRGAERALETEIAAAAFADFLHRYFPDSPPDIQVRVAMHSATEQLEADFDIDYARRGDGSLAGQCTYEGDAQPSDFLEIPLGSLQSKRSLGANADAWHTLLPAKAWEWYLPDRIAVGVERREFIDSAVRDALAPSQKPPATSCRERDDRKACATCEFDTGGEQSGLQICWQGHPLWELKTDPGQVPQHLLTRSIRPVQLSGGSRHGIALMADGSVKCWGPDEETYWHAPLLDVRVLAIAAGFNHCIALLEGGEVRCWGPDEETYWHAPPLDVRVLAIAAGRDHCIALLEGGEVRCWGRPGFACTVPPATAVGVRAIAAGDYHSLALREDGTVLAWGWNGYGQCAVPNGVKKAVAINADLDWSAAILQDRSKIFWGSEKRRPDWEVEVKCGYFCAHYERGLDAGTSYQLTSRNRAVAFGLATCRGADLSGLELAGYVGGEDVERFKHQLAALDVIFYWDSRDKSTMEGLVRQGSQQHSIRDHFKDISGRHPFEYFQNLRVIDSRQSHGREGVGRASGNSPRLRLPRGELADEIRSMLLMGPQASDAMVLDSWQMDSALYHVSSGITQCDEAVRLAAASCLRGRMSDCSHLLAHLCQLKNLTGTGVAGSPEPAPPKNVPPNPPWHI